MSSDTSASSKRCTDCGVTKLMSEFASAGSKRYPLQRRANCRDCVIKKTSERPKKTTADPYLMPEKCSNSACTAKDPTFKWRTDCGRYTTKCKQCIRQDTKNASARKGEERSSNGVVECTDCGIIKPTHMFECDRNYCKECHLKRRKDTALNNADTSRENIPLPEGRCNKCSTEFTDETVIWRNDTKTWRMDKCKKCPYNPEYSKRYRQKMEDEDYHEYRRRCNETHKKWVANNPDKVAKYQHTRRTKPESKVMAIMNSANTKGIPFDITADFKQMVLDPCFYCDSQCSERSLRGIDRVDNSIGFTAGNTVPACSCCNHMKCTKKFDEFLADIRRIATHLHLNDDDINLEAEKSIVFGRHLDEPKKKSMELSYDQQLLIKCSPCEYCGINFSCGIDRVDSDGSYTIDNVVPCCTTCNYMKCHLTLEQFKSHVSRIHRHTKNFVLKDTENIMTTTCNGQARPYALDCEYGTLVFPSVNTAESMGVSRMIMHQVSCKERRNNNMNRDTAMKIIQSIILSLGPLSTGR